MAKLKSEYKWLNILFEIVEDDETIAWGMFKMKDPKKNLWIGIHSTELYHPPVAKYDKASNIDGVKDSIITFEILTGLINPTKLKQKRNTKPYNSPLR